MKRFIAAAVIFLVLGPGCSKNESPLPARPEVEVATTVVQVRDVDDVSQSVGTVEPKREAVVSARIMGTIKEIRTDEGDRVSAGNTLVVIDADEIRAKRSEAEHARDEGQAALSEAEAALENAEINYSRIKSLYDEEAVSKKELDDMTTHRSMAAAKVGQIKARIAQADAAVKQADVMLGYSVIVSPLSGVVVSKTANVGETAAPGMPLLKIVNDTELRVATTVKESAVSGLEIGDEMEVSVDALSGLKLKAVVSDIVPAADPSTRSFVVKLDLPETRGLMPGMFARALLPAGTRPAVVLPEDSLLSREGVDGVYVVGDDAVINFQSVSLGRELDGGREVLAGLSGGERVVVGELSGVREGMRAVVR